MSRPLSPRAALLLAALALAARSAGPAVAGDEKPCRSIRPGAWKAVGRMLAAGRDEARRDSGPFVPQRPPEERRARREDLWTHGVRWLGHGARGAGIYERLADGARIVLVPGGEVELGVPERLRGEVPPVTVLTACPAHVVRLAPGVPLREGMVLRDPYPARRVALAPFAIDETEVTWRQYREYQRGVLRRKLPKRHAWAGDDHPVTGVTWREAAGYCDWVGGRLPTDAEWEHAARGPDALAWPWGDEWPPPAGAGNLADASLAAALCEEAGGLPDDGFVYTAPAGSFPRGASPFGILDLLGNAAEWIDDWAGDVDLTVAPVAQPCPPSRRDLREKVERGRSFFESSVLERPSDRAWERTSEWPWVREPTRGFRCAHDGPP